MGDSKHSVDSVSFYGWNYSNLILCIPHCMGQLICYLQVHFRNLLQFESELIQICKYFYLSFKTIFYLDFRVASSYSFPLNFFGYITLICIPKSDCGCFLGSCYHLIEGSCCQIQLHVNFSPDRVQLDIYLRYLEINWKSILYKNLLPLCVYQNVQS